MRRGLKRILRNVVVVKVGGVPFPRHLIEYAHPVLFETIMLRMLGGREGTAVTPKSSGLSHAVSLRTAL